MAYTKYSLTPANNTAAPPDGAPEGMLPSAVNDTMRDMMAQIRDCGDGIRDGTYTMTAPKITGGTITGSTINNSAIGGTTAAAGKFTTLEATGVTTVQAGTVSLPAITTTGDTNTGIFFPAADTIAFTEGGTESMRIDSSGNVGIGTSSPAAQLDVGSHLLFGLANDFLSNSSSCLIARTSAAGTGIFSEAGHLLLQPRSSFGRSIIFATGSTTAAERMRIPAAGGVQAVTTISVGNATPSASGAGITFPATQSASSDANTLDDYEEGTWTPTLTYTGGNGDLSYAINDGTYIKIGKMVMFTCHLQFSETTASGYIDTINGLPFTSTARAGGGFNIDNMTGLTGGAQWQMLSSATTIIPLVSGTGNGTPIYNTSTAASSVIVLSGVYRA